MKIWAFNILFLTIRKFLSFRASRALRSDKSSKTTAIYDGCQQRNKERQRIYIFKRYGPFKARMVKFPQLTGGNGQICWRQLDWESSRILVQSNRRLCSSPSEWGNGLADWNYDGYRIPHLPCTSTRDFLYHQDILKKLTFVLSRLFSVPFRL